MLPEVQKRLKNVPVQAIMLCLVLCGLICALSTDSFALAIMLVQSVFFSFNLFSGTMWPKEGMHWVLAAIADYTPMIQPSMALKGVLQRGWEIWHPVVVGGIIAATVWLTIMGVILIGWTLCLQCNNRRGPRRKHKTMKLAPYPKPSPKQ